MKFQINSQWGDISLNLDDEALKLNEFMNDDTKMLVNEALQNILLAMVGMVLAGRVMPVVAEIFLRKMAEYCRESNVVIDLVTSGQVSEDELLERLIGDLSKSASISDAFDAFIQSMPDLDELE